MTAATIWQLLFVDDDPVICRQVKEFLEDESISPDDHIRVETLHDFGNALNELEMRRFDLVILDVRLGSYSGTPEEEAGTNPSCHLLKSMGFCLTLTVKSPISPQEEQAHGRQNYRDVLPV